MAFALKWEWLRGKLKQVQTEVPLSIQYVQCQMGWGKKKKPLVSYNPVIVYIPVVSAVVFVTYSNLNFLKKK